MEQNTPKFRLRLNLFDGIVWCWPGPWALSGCGAP